MRRFCVIGLGTFGLQVARTLFEDGQEVIAVDSRRERVQLAHDISTYAIVGDAANKEFLAAEGIADVNAAIVSTGERSHLSTLITLYLKELGVPKILVKAINEDHGRILTKVGASDLIFPERDMATKVARSLSAPNILDFIPLADDFSISEVAPAKGFIGKTLVELDLRRAYGITVIGIRDVLTGQFLALPDPGRKMRDSDVLIVAGRPDDISRALGK